MTVYKIETTLRWYVSPQIKKQRITRYMYPETLQEYIDRIIGEGFEKVNDTLFVLKQYDIEINENIIESRVRKSLDSLKSNFDATKLSEWDYIQY